MASEKSISSDSMCVDGSVSHGSERASSEQARSVPEPVRKLRDKLKEKYLRACVDLVGGQNTTEVSVEDVHVNLIIVSRPELREEFEKSSSSSSQGTWRVDHVLAASLDHISLESIFDMDGQSVSNGGRTYRILVAAAAGCGKTFIFTRVAPLKWAKAEMWNKFALVLTRKLYLKEVRRAANVCDLFGVGELGEFTGEERQAIDDFVREQPHRVCVVLDGLDEASDRKRSGFLSDIIRGEILRGIRLLVTSRPCQEMLSLGSKKEFDASVELVGFRQEDVEHFIKKVMKEPEEASALVSEVQNDPYLFSMMATPFLAMQVCKVFNKHDHGLPRCKADLVEVMIRPKESHMRTDALSPKVLALRLGKLAFIMLKNQQQIFTDHDLESYAIPRYATSLGILNFVAANTTAWDDRKRWMFSHVMLQEALAATYVGERTAKTPERVVQLVESLGPESSHLHTFWALLTAQLDEEKADCLINSLLTREKVTERSAPNSDDDELNQCALRTIPSNVLDMLLVRLEYCDLPRLAEELLCEPLNQQSGKEYVNDEIRRGRQEYTGEVFLKTLLLTWEKLCHDSSCASLATVLGRMKRESLAESVTASAAQDAPLQGRFHKEVDGQRTRNLKLAVKCCAEPSRHHGNGNGGDQLNQRALGSLAAAFKCMTISISGRDDPATTCAYDKAIHLHSSAVRKVRIADFNPDSCSSLPHSLLSCRALTDITVYACKLQWHNITSIVASSYETIKQFRMENCELGGSSTASHPASYPLCHDAKAASASSTCESGQNPSQLPDSAFNAPGLECFRLSSVSGLDLQQVCDDLRQSLNLTKVLINNPLPSCCIASLARNLSSAWHNLRSLTLWLSHDALDELADDDVVSFVAAANQCESLEQLCIWTDAKELEDRNSPAAWSLLSESSYTRPSLTFGVLEKELED